MYDGNTRTLRVYSGFSNSVTNGTTISFLVESILTSNWTGTTVDTHYKDRIST